MDIALFILIIFVVMAILSIVIGLYVLVAVMAKNRHREVLPWFFLSLITSPVLIIIILLCIGEDERYVSQYR